jgi:hypothetical protein
MARALHHIGVAMCYFVLTNSLEVVSRSSVLHMTIVKRMKDKIKAKKEAYDNEVAG